MAGAGGDELLRPGKLDQRRPLRPQSDKAGEVLEEDLLFRPECPADPRLDHADPMEGVIEGVGNDPPDVKRDLGRGAQDQPPVRIEIGEDDVRLDRGVLCVLKLADGLHDNVRFGEPLSNITNVNIHIGGDVPFRIVDPSGILLIVDHRSTGSEGSVDREDRRELLVLNLYRLYRLRSDLLRLRRHGGEAVADESHLRVEHPRVVRGRLGVPLAGGGEPLKRCVLVGEDEGDARDRLRL